jgi:hypothetical protein
MRADHRIVAATLIVIAHGNSPSRRTPAGPLDRTG